jgi:hypothetical protein
MRKSRLVNGIRKAISKGVLTNRFTVADINRCCKNLLLKSPSFLSKHCIENPGGYKAYFKRVSKGVYTLVEN